MVRICFLFLALFILLPKPVLAQIPEDAPYRLEPMVVTATAEPVPESEVPAPVQVITAEEIQRTGAETLDEVLFKKTPVHLHKIPGATGIGIRGFRTLGFGAEPDIENRVLVLIDGNRAGTGNVAIIPVQNVERIEVVRGPGSVLYGGSAMGGVVNVITRRGSGDPEAAAGVEAGSFGYRKLRGSVSGGLAEDRFGFSLAGRVQKRDDYHIGEDGGELENTGFESRTISGSVAMELAERSEVRLVANLHDANDVGQPGPTYFSSETDFVDEDHSYLSLTYDKLPGTGRISLHLSGYTTGHEYAFNSPDFATTTITDTETTGARARIGLPATKWGRLLVGTEYAHIESSHSGSVFAPDSQYDIYAGFAEQRFEFSRSNVFFGIRYDHYTEEIQDTPGLDVTEDREDFSHLSWRGGAVYKLTDWISVRGGVGTGFRPPAADELVGDYTTFFLTYRGNPDLEAETSITYEAGTDIAAGGFEAGATIFHTKSDDTIVARSVAPQVLSYTNLEGITLTGLEGSAAYVLPFRISDTELLLRPYLNWITYLQRENEDETTAQQLGTDIPFYIPKTSVTAGILLEIEDFLSLETGLVYTGRQKEENFRFTGPPVLDKDPFTVWYARARVSPRERLALFLHIENLTDERYEFLDGYPMPGRTVTGGVEYRF